MGQSTIRRWTSLGLAIALALLGNTVVLSVAHATTCSGSVSSYTSGGSTYSFVTFNTVGSCSWTVPTDVTSVDALVVGGGGGGGAWVGGGGGGGGAVETSGIAVTPGASETVLIGAGGVGAQMTSTLTRTGSAGNSTSFAGTTALGGGAGASWTSQSAGGAGTANGGGGSQVSGAYSGGIGQFFTGGSASTDSQPHPVGGGAGAGGNGASGASGASGNGGIGFSSSITGTATFYGGGGGGSAHQVWTGPTTLQSPQTLIEPGVGGLGGGGTGGKVISDVTGSNVTGANGTDGRGGGGGGAATYYGTSYTSTGGDGGDGVVIIRWLSSTGGDNGSSSAVTTPAPTFTLTITPPVGVTCRTSGESATSGSWVSLPAANDCTSPATTPNAQLLGWATTPDFPKAIAQRQIANGWGAYEIFDASGRITAVFIPAGGAILVSAPGSLFPIWRS